MAKNKGGRPRLPDEEAKRAAFTFRTTNSLRGQLTAAAEESGLSIAQEIERRLELSFFEEAIMGGRDKALLAKLIASAASLIEIETQRRWTEDRMTWAAVNAAVQRIMAWFQPHLDLDIWKRHDPKLFAFLERVNQLEQARREIDGLSKAYPSSDDMPAEAKALHDRAIARYPELLKEVRRQAKAFFDGPLREQRERDREAIKLGRQIAGERQGTRAGSFIVGGVMRMYKSSGAFEPLPGLRDPGDISEEELFDCIRLLAGEPPDDPDMEVFRMKRTYEDFEREENEQEGSGPPLERNNDSGSA